jgi:hypothetical protein
MSRLASFCLYARVQAKIYLLVYTTEFQTFINKYSFVNSKFVKDFYNIIKEDYIERYSDFLIDSEILRANSYILQIDEYLMIRLKKVIRKILII